MIAKKRMELIWRWSLVTGGLIALFWAIWYLIAGEVPVLTNLKMTEEWTLVLPFGISRWWDTLIGPIWSTLLILLFTSQRVRENEGLVGLVFGLGYSLVFGLVFGLVCGLVYSLGFGLVYGLVILIRWRIAWIAKNFKPFLVKAWDWLMAHEVH